MLEFLAATTSYIVPFLLVLTIVVTIHELGHFLAARSFGVAVDQFSIGFGRAIARWTDKRGVEWRIGWLPLGGYVRFAEDENASSIPDRQALETMRAEIRAREGPGAERRYFHFKPVWQRAIVVAAGPAANFILSTALFAALLGVIGEVVVPPRVASVAAGSPAERAGFLPGDVVLRAGDRAVESFFDVQEVVAVRSGAPIRFRVRRDDRIVALTATPERREMTDVLGGRQKIGYLGLGSPPASEAYRQRYGPVDAVGHGAERTWRVLETTVFYLGRMVRGRESADQLGGPLRIADESRKAAKLGADSGGDVGEKLGGIAVTLLGLTAVLSVGIGFLNLLPVPALDGGHLAFYAYEALARRPVGAGVQAASYRVGLALLLGLMLFVTWNDLQRLQVFRFLGGLFS